YALLPFGPEEKPATSPCLLMATACPQLSLPNSGTRCKPFLSLHMKGTIADPVFDTPMISPASLILVAELYSALGNTPRCFALSECPQSVAPITPPLPALRPTMSPRLFSLDGI